MKNLVGYLLTCFIYLFNSYAMGTTINESMSEVSSLSQTKHPTATNSLLENYNRQAYKLNSELDTNIVRPAAVGYVTYIPLPIRNALANFFNNLRDFITLGNDILQLNGRSAMKNTMRISINSTIGLFGIIDVSSSLGLFPNKNSFGNTLKVYGWTNSSYLIVPLFGPSTIRDTIGMVPDIVFNPTWYLIDNNYISISLFTLSAINTRSKFLGFDQVLNTSIDPYITMRDTYLAAIGESIPSQGNESNNINIDSLIGDESSEINTSKSKNESGFITK